MGENFQRAEMTNLSVLNVWREQLLKLGGEDTLLHFSESNAIDITHAHPSGLAQILTGRDTYLSSLIRDGKIFAKVFKNAQAILAKTVELSNERGINAGYLAVGVASWFLDSSSLAGQDNESTVFKAPILLIPLTITARGSKNDFSLRLESGAKINPALIRAFSKHYSIQLDSDFLVGLAYAGDRFDPLPMLDNLRTKASYISAVNITNQLFVSTFADITEPFMSEKFDLDHPVVAALFGKVAAKEKLSESFETVQPPLDQRVPVEELLLADADQSQQNVLDAVLANRSVCVHTTAGSGVTQTILNTIGGLVSKGKSVLVVGERRGALYELYQKFNSLDLGSLPIFIDNSNSLVKQLTKAIVRNEKACKPDVAGIQSSLLNYRKELIEQDNILHTKCEPWGVSPYEAMQSLAKLMSLHPAPKTAVRLKPEVLKIMGDRQQLGQQLKHAAQLGSFELHVSDSAWYGAALFSQEDSQRAYKIVCELANGEFASLYKQMFAAAKHAQISLGADMRSWGAQLSLLIAVRESLDKFTSDIFERSAKELIIATSSARWRKETGSDMGTMMRSRLRKLAKEFIRPGVHVGDLHSALIKVQEQRAAWKHYANTQRNPQVPAGLSELDSFYRKTVSKLQILGKFLDTTVDGGALLDMRYDELSARLSALANDRKNLDLLPKRNMITKTLKEQGFGQFLDDLARRKVTADRVVSELDLAWWQSVLENMLSQERASKMLSGDKLRQLEAEYRLADQAHIESGASRLLWFLAQRWKQVIVQYPGQAVLLKKALQDEAVDFGGFLSKASDVLKTLAPVSFVSPYSVPSVVPFGQHFDVVIILDADSLPTSVAISSISRAKQLVVFGDANLGFVTDFSVAVGDSSRVVLESNKPVVSVFESLQDVLLQKSLNFSYRQTDPKLLDFLKQNYYGESFESLPAARDFESAGSSFVVEHIPKGTGMPLADAQSVESVEVEVARVVDLVFAHASVSPLQSLAVITISKRHAARIAEAIKLQLPNYPLSVGFFSRQDEPFVILDVDRAFGLSRDAVIFSLGYGRTPHGRVIYNFGALSEVGGSKRFVLALTRARTSLRVLTCFKAQDLDPQRLTYGACDFYKLLLASESSREGGDLVLGGGVSSGVADVGNVLLADLVERIRACGLRAYANYGGLIDLVVGAMNVSEGDAVLPLAIDTDGSLSFRSLSVRERIRLRPQRLERFGWRYVPMRSLEMFTNPDGCVEIVSAYSGCKFDSEDVHLIRNNFSGSYFLVEGKKPVDSLVVSDSVKRRKVVKELQIEGYNSSFGERG